MSHYVQRPRFSPPARPLRGAATIPLSLPTPLPHTAHHLDLLPPPSHSSEAIIPLDLMKAQLS